MLISLNNVVFPVIDLILAVFFFAKLGMAYFDYMKTLIMAAAAERYTGLIDPTPAHRLALLRQKLEQNPEDEEVLWELFGAVIAQVSIGKGGEISLYQNDKKECAS